MVIKIRKTAVLLSLLALSLAAFLFVGALKYTAVPTAGRQSVRVTVIMYHQISKNSGNVGKYVIDAKELEKDFIWLRDNGYETVSVRELTDYVSGFGTLPEKSVLLTFDDGYETGFTVLYPLLKKYNMKAVISVVGSYTELFTENEDHNDKYSYLDREEVRLLSKSPLVEIGNHSFDMHYYESGKRRGINKLSGETYDAYRKAVTADVGKMQEYLMKITGNKPYIMAYPFGEYNKDTAEICGSLGLPVTFTCEEKPCIVTQYQKASLTNIGRYNRSGTADREKFFGKILSD